MSEFMKELENRYLVILLDKIDGIEHSTECTSEDGLARFLMGVDKERYDVIRIDCLGPVSDNATFIKKTDGLEQGF